MHVNHDAAAHLAFDNFRGNARNILKHYAASGPEAAAAPVPFEYEPRDSTR